jgi:endoglucanase
MPHLIKPNRRTLLKAGALAAPTLLLSDRLRAQDPTCCTLPQLAASNVTPTAPSVGAPSLSGGGVAPVGLFGVNVSGPEFPPTNWQQATCWAQASDWSYLGSKKLPFVRQPVAWENIQANLNGALTASFLSSLKRAIASAYAQRIGVIVEIHNFGCHCTSTLWRSGTVGYAGNAGNMASGVNYFGDGTLTPSAFGNLWGLLAQALAGTPGVFGYGLMNEPGPWNWSTGYPLLTVSAIQPYYQAAINAIRQYDSDSWIFVMLPDNYQNHYNIPTLLNGLTDSANKLMLEWHLYFDGPPGVDNGGPGVYSGNFNSYGQNASGGVTDVSGVVGWATSNNKQVLIGEFAWPNDSTTGWNGGSVGQWMTLGNNLLADLATNHILATWWCYTALAWGYGGEGGINPSGGAGTGTDSPLMTQLLSYSP